jgi:3-oxoacyl-[acyl-carrier-protein] synthase-3
MSVESKGFAGALSGGAPVRHSRISGIGGYRPKRVVPNAEIVDLIDSSDEWIRERSGIIERRFAGPDEGIIEMTEWAAQPALEMAGIEGKDLDAVIMATVTWPYQTPAAAPLLAERLGSKGAAFDISAACAGYCHGIALASDMVRTSQADNVLVLGVERLSDFTDPKDRGTAFIFGDGAGAAVVSASDSPGIGPTVWGSDGAQWDAISQRESWIDVHAKDLGWPTIGMAGQTVFRWAVWGMAPVAQRALDAAGITADQLDAFIPHQANVRIIDAMIKQLRLPPDIPVARDIAYTGNTSAASIPLAMERMVRHGEIPRGGLALQIGFGAGLAYAAQVVVIP